jgi:hypothetical protein
MTGTSCATGEVVLSDAKCSVTCAAGYEATGDFVCHHGAYTSTPACVEAGSEVTTKTFVKGSLALSLNAAGKTAAELEQDPAFKAAAGEAVAKAMAMKPSLVEITQVRAAAARRLSEEAEAQASPLALVVEYRVQVADAAAAAALQKQLAEIPKDQFAKEFTATLEKSYEGVTVASLEVASTQTMVEYTVAPAAGKAGTSYKQESFSSLDAALLGGILGLVLLVGLYFLVKFLKKKGAAKSKAADLEAGNQTNSSSAATGDVEAGNNQV